MLLLSVVVRVKDREQWLRKFYADVFELGHILFGDPGQSAPRAKQQIRELRGRWKVQVANLKAKGDERAVSVLSNWEGTTETYWDGLFHCYTYPRIPATNNGTEQLIAHLKTLERVLAKNPNPAVRFLRNAAVNAMFVNRETMPDKEFIASRTAEDFARAKAATKGQAKKTGIMRKARKNIKGLMNQLLTEWDEATTGPPRPESMNGRGRSTS